MSVMGTADSWRYRALSCDGALDLRGGETATPAYFPEEFVEVQPAAARDGKTGTIRHPGVRPNGWLLVPGR